MANTTWAGIGWSRGLSAALSTLLLCACDSAVVPPYLNPHPTKWVTIRVFAPSTLKIQRTEAWNPNSHPFGAAAACNLPGGMRTPLYVPVALRWDGSSYVGRFLEDRYLPESVRLDLRRRLCNRSELGHPCDLFRHAVHRIPVAKRKQSERRGVVRYRSRPEAVVTL